MSNAIVQVLEDAARKVAVAVEDAAKSVGKFFDETAQRLETSAENHVEHDGRAASELERAARHGDETPSVHGAGSSAPVRAAAAEPGGGAGFPHELESATDLPDPTRRLHQSDHPYLQPSSKELESEAIPGAKPRTDAQVVGDTSNHPELPDAALGTFSGDVTPEYMTPDKTYYRWVGDSSYPNGAFWSEHPPTGGTSELRSDYAVLNEWNGDHGVVAFRPSHPVPVYRGEVAPQYATGSTDHYLPGGATQLWMPPGALSDKDGPWVIAPTPEGKPS